MLQNTSIICSVIVIDCITQTVSCSGKGIFVWSYLLCYFKLSDHFCAKIYFHSELPGISHNWMN